MKKIIFILPLIFLSQFIAAQIGHDLTIFSEDGLKFKVKINGAYVNDNFASSVKAENINEDYVKAIIEFQDTTIAPIKRNILQIKSASNPNGEPEAVVYQIKKKKEEYVVKWSSASRKKIQNQVIIQQAAPSTPSNGVQININPH